MTTTRANAWGFALVALCASTCAPALGLDLRQAWINPGFYSYHLQRDKDLNNVNTGLGVELPLTDTYSVTAGVFDNSDRATSHYMGLYAMPYRLGPFKAGVVMGAFNGYPKAFDGGWFPAVIPVVSMEGRQLGLNVSFVPTVGDKLHGAVTFQLKYRFAD